MICAPLNFHCPALCHTGGLSGGTTNADGIVTDVIGASTDARPGGGGGGGGGGASDGVTDNANVADVALACFSSGVVAQSFERTLVVGGSDVGVPDETMGASNVSSLMPGILSSLDMSRSIMAAVAFSVLGSATTAISPVSSDSEIGSPVMGPAVDASGREADMFGGAAAGI